MHNIYQWYMTTRDAQRTRRKSVGRRNAGVMMTSRPDDPTKIRRIASSRRCWDPKRSMADDNGMCTIAITPPPPPPPEASRTESNLVSHFRHANRQTRVFPCPYFQRRESACDPHESSANCVKATCLEDVCVTHKDQAAQQMFLR